MDFKETVLLAGRVVLSLVVAGLVYLNLGLYAGVPQSMASWILAALTLLYLIYTIRPTGLVAKVFGIACMLSGILYLARENNIVSGLLLTAAGLFTFCMHCNRKKAEK